LLNVVVSRARGKLLLIADLGFLQHKHPSTSPARRLLELVVERGAATVAAEALLPRLAAPSLRWTDSWPSAVTELSQLLDREPTSVDVSVADEHQAGEWLTRLAHTVPAAGHAMTVRAPIPVAVQLEETAADLKLRTLGPAPVAFAGEAAMAVGSIDPGKPALCITDRVVVVAARRRLLAE
jgi:hypothetical protein